MCLADYDSSIDQPDCQIRGFRIWQSTYEDGIPKPFRYICTSDTRYHLHVHIHYFEMPMGTNFGTIDPFPVASKVSTK